MQMTWGLFKQRWSAYRQFLRQPAGQIILADLAKFCNANATSFRQADPHTTAFNEGKRAVWIRIQQHLNLTDEELYAILGGVTLRPKEETDG